MKLMSQLRILQHNSDRMEQVRSVHRVFQYKEHIENAYSTGNLYNLFGTKAKMVHEILKDHYEEKLTTEATINELQTFLRIDTLKEDLLKMVERPKVEFHPVSFCNYRCNYCSWLGNRDDSRYKYLPFSSLQNTKYFHPKAIAISGGFCEPSLYKDSDQEASMTDFILALDEQFPRIALGMNSNGSKDIGPGVALLEWLRINVDAGTEETYRRKKLGNRMPKHTLEDVLLLAREYIDREFHGRKIQNLGIGFLYMRDNIEEIPDFLVKVYHLFKSARNIQALNFQFRPLRPLMPEREEVVKANTYSNACTPEQFDHLKSEFSRLIASCPDLGDFIINFTNYTEIFERYTMGNIGFGLREYPSTCGVPLVSTIISASGFIYPCLECAEVGNFNPKQRMIIADFTRFNEEKERVKFSLNSYYATNRVCSFCNKYECSQGELIHPINDLITKKIRVNEKKPSSAFF